MDPNPNDTPQSQSWKKCPDPLAPSFPFGLCPSCMIASSPEPDPSSSQEHAPYPNASDPSQTCHFVTEQAGGDDLGSEDKVAGYETGNSNNTNECGIEKATTNPKAKDSKDNSEQGEPTNDETTETDNRIAITVDGDHKPLPDIRKRQRGRPSTKADALKLTPACAGCKRAKVRCMHRRVLNEDGIETPLDTGTDDSQLQSPPHAEKKTVRLHIYESQPWKLGSSTPSSPPQTRRKRKLAETGPEAEDDTSRDVANGSAEEREEEDDTPQQQAWPSRRARQARKSTTNRPPIIEDDISDATHAPSTVDSTPESNRSLAPSAYFPTDLEGAALLSQHVVLSRRLQQRIDDCHTKWVDAMESMTETKRTLDTWVDAWKSGR